MSLSLADVNAEALEAVWTLDTAAGPIALAGGQVSLDRSWTPALQATVDYDTQHPLAAQVEPLTRDPLVLRLRTQTAGLPILAAGDDKPQNLLSNGDFENGLTGWTAVSGSAIVKTAYNDRMWGGLGGRLMELIATDTAQWSTMRGTVPTAATAGKWLAFAAMVACDGVALVRLQARYYLDGYQYSPTSQYTADFYPGRRLQHSVFIPEGATSLTVELQMNKPVGEAGVRMWADKVIAVAADTEAEALAGVAEFRAGVLGEYEWPEDTSGARVNQVAYWVYPRSTRESRSQGRTSVELASADLLLVEQRNGSAEPWIAPPSRIFGGDRNYAMTRTASQLIVHAGLRVTVGAQADETSPEREPTWEPGDNVWGFIQGLLRSRYEWRFDPKINAMSLLLGSAAPEAFESAGRLNAIDSTVTRGDSTELGTLDFADGLLITWQWEGNDGSTNSRLETIVAAHLDSWRDVTKWAELTINSAPQTYGARLLDTRVARIAQGTHTLALDEWSIDDLGIAYWDGPSRFQTLSFSVDGGTYTITSPLQEA